MAKRVPGSLEDLHKAILHAMEVIRVDVAGTGGGKVDRAFGGDRFTDSSQTIAIMGDRGSGKTTLLTSVCASLTAIGDDLVLPIMRPELFHEGDTVIGAFLASVSMAVEATPIADIRATQDEQPPPPSPHTTLLRTVSQTAREYAMSRTTLQALEYSSAGPFDFAEDSVAVARSGTAVFWALRRLVEQVRHVAKADREALIVVPIDDPDLAPTSIVRILQDLRVLGSIPGVVPMACFCTEDLSASWLGTVEKELPAMSSAQSVTRLTRVMEKIFPYRNRFEIESLTVRQRVAFSPIGHSETLAQKLQAFASIAADITGTASTFAQALSRGEPVLNLESPLPGNARTLVQLWESLDSFLTGPGRRDPDHLILTLRRLMDILGEPFSSGVGAGPGGRVVAIGGPIESVKTKRAATSKRHASFRRRDTELFITAAGEYEGTEDDVASVQLRHLVAIRAGRPSEITSTGASSREYLQPDAVSALLAVQELVYGSGAFEIEDTPTSIGDVEWRFLQRVTAGGLATDNMFVLLPEAVTLTEVARVAALWTRLVKFCERRRTPEQIFAAVIAASCTYVDEETPGQVGRRSAEYEESFARASELFEQRASSPAHLDRMYCRWYRTYLPFQWHSAFFASSRARFYIDQHLDVSRRSAPSSDEDIGLALFDARIRSLTEDITDEDDAQDRAWLAGYFDLAAAWGSEYTGRLAELHPLWQRRMAAQRAGAAALGSAPRAVSVRRFAPYETPEGQELLDAALAVLRRAKSKALADLRSARR